MLKKILFFCFVVCFSSVGAMEWHSWDDEPKESQLYMYAVINEEQDAQTLVIRRYCSENPIYQDRERGWWCISKDTVWWLLHKESKVLYLPQ
jgi:hypothetical protein